MRSHFGEPARLTGPAHLHMNSLLFLQWKVFSVHIMFTCVRTCIYFDMLNSCHKAEDFFNDNTDAGAVV